MRQGIFAYSSVHINRWQKNSIFFETFHLRTYFVNWLFSIKRENEIRNEIFSNLPKGSQDHWTLSLSLQLILMWKNEECIHCRIQQREKSSQTGNIILNSVFRPLFSTRFEIKHPPQVRGCIAAESIQTSDVLNIFVIRVLLASLLTFWTFGTGHSRIEQIEMWKRDSATKAANQFKWIWSICSMSNCKLRSMCNKSKVAFEVMNVLQSEAINYTCLFKWRHELSKNKLYLINISR